MSADIRKYKVAEHVFAIEMDACSALWENIRKSYGPFQVRVSDDSDLLFHAKVCDECQKPDGMALVYSNADDVEPGYVVHDVYKGETGHYFEFTQPWSDGVNGRLFLSYDLKDARLSLHGNDMEKWNTFTVSMNFCFMLATSCMVTVFFHSSCVEYQGKAYMFLGKSGTGKSTHSRMWQEALEGVSLMNDDHPIVRIDESGQVRAYGSPWSGKTPCYRNVSAPVGGIVRICRAPYNKARRLSPIEAYASIMTSCSGMTWERDMADGRDRTMQGIIRNVPCWVMECLPDNDAAVVCADAVTKVL